MNAGIFTIEVFGHQINNLRDPAGKDCIKKNCLPVLPHVITAHLSPSDDQQDHHDQNDDTQLPAQTYHHDLQRYHQQDCVEVVEDRQYLYLLVYPGRFQPCRRQHRKQYTCRSRGCKPAQQKVFFPSFSTVPVNIRKQHEHIYNATKIQGKAAVAIAIK